MQHRMSRRVMQMNALEIQAIQNFSASFVDDIHPILIANVLRQNWIINEIIFETIQLMQRRRVDRKIILQELINETTKNCSLDHLIKVLYDNGFKCLAQKLFICYNECKNTMNDLRRVHRSDTRDRRKIGEYFKQIKKQVHELVFKNAYSHIQFMGESIRKQISEATDDEAKMVLCDKFVALKAAEMDALTNVAGRVDKNHPGYRAIENYISSTSNTELTRVILYGRQSDVLSTTGNFEEAEDLMKQALVCADTSGSCVEITDMYYKNVVVKLSKFENNPYDENLRKSILYEADKGLWTLQDEKEDLRLFWTKLFLLRMAFAHLGIGKFCHMVRNYVPHNDSVVEAERILQMDALRDLEHRRQMFMAVAKARLSEWKGNMDSSMEYLNKARQLAHEGKYAENEALEEYEQYLNRDYRQTSSMSPNVTSGTYALDSFGTSAISVQMTNPSYQSTNEDDTDIKHVQSTDEDDTDIKLLPGESTYSPSNLYLSDAPQLSDIRTNSSNESFAHLSLNSLQANPSEQTSDHQNDQDQTESNDSLPSLHLSSFENERNN